MKLDVELSADIEMGNEYANRIGEVDWVFIVEEYTIPDDDEPETTAGIEEPPTVAPETEPIPTPEPIKSSVIITDEYDPFGVLGAGDFPFGVLPMTGDETNVTPYLLLLGVGVLGMIVTVFGKRKKDV